MFPRFPGRLALAGLVGLSAPFLSAEQADPDEHMVVTASRSEQALSDSLASVTLIDRDQIEISQAPDLLELLRHEAGVDMARTGGPGGQTSLFLRGSNSNHVLVLIDGVRVSAAGTGAFAWELLDVNLIERIEIVRGPRAARWGSDAIGGVIQIFTRQARGLGVRAGYGRYRDRSIAATMGTGQAGLTIAGRQVGGYSSQNERGFAFDPDDDGFENISAATSGSTAAGPGHLNWSARLAAGTSEFDQGESDFLNYAARLEYQTDGQGPWQWLTSAGLYRDRLETETPFGESEVVTRRVQTAFQGQRNLDQDNRWMVGVDTWKESGVSRNAWSEQRYNVGIWTGIDGRAGDIEHEVAIRLDRDQLFGNAVSGNLAAGWPVADDWRLTASLGRAFRAPNFDQLFSPGFNGLFAGNPELDPETSWSSELGVQWQPHTRQRLTLAAFENRIDDLIDFSGTDFQAINIREARIRGAELTWHYTDSNWRSRAQLTWQDSTDRETGQRLLRRARENASVSLDRRFGASWIGGEIVHVGDRVDVGQQPLPSHTLINLRAGYALPAGFRLEGRVENLTDRDYEQVFGFNTHRRSLFVAVSWES